MPDASRNRADRNLVKDRRGAGSVWGSPLWARYRCKWSPRSSPGTTLFVDVSAKISSKIFQRTLQRLYCPGRKGTEGVARSKKFRLKHERIEIASGSSALFHCEQNLLRPREATPARGTPPARFLRKQLFQIPHHADPTHLLVDHDHAS